VFEANEDARRNEKLISKVLHGDDLDEKTGNVVEAKNA